MFSSIGGTTDNIVRKKWLNDLVIMELNFRLFKLETIIQVLAHERSDRQAKLKFTDEFSSMTFNLCDLLNSMFADLIEAADPDEDIALDYLREEELRLCLEGEEKMRFKHQKLIVEDNRIRLDEAKRLRLEEENMLQLEQQNKNKRKEFMNSSHRQIKCKFPWNDDYIADRNFWLKLVCLDLARKGWLTEEHIDLWVDYMWHVRPENSDWATVSCYFVQLLLQKGMPLFYVNGERYTTPWSELDQPRRGGFPSGAKKEWGLFPKAKVRVLHTAQLDVTLMKRANIDVLPSFILCLERSHFMISSTHMAMTIAIDIVTLLFHNDNQRDFQLVRDTYVSCQQLMVRCEERHAQILELQNLVGSTVVTESVQLPVVLERKDIFQKNGIDTSKYTITFRLADNVPKQGAYMLIVKPSTSSMDNSKRIDDSTENYSLFEVNYDGMFDERPLSYFPQNLVSYYFKNLTFDDAHGDIQSKVTSHEKLKSHGKLALMTFDEIRSWEKEHSLSLLLRTPPLKKRRKGIAFQGKNLYAKFLHANCVDDHFDVLEEPVGCDGGSLPGKIKDEFSNEVILDDVVSSPATLSMLLKRKGKSRVKFTRMRGIIKRSKMISLRMRVRSNY
uniref:Phospholipase-like protein n=1 Tax=Tanacetum cinerariifolium TaxID=118510 RepID=A0A6L2KSI8_TANCI|nr:phospholipase-like protein [Tanacetum cinerariifolium]